jgi:DNA polymerase
MELAFDGGCIIYRYVDGERQFLFLKRAPGGWLDLPKGHIEKGETAEAAAIRETKEEAGLTIKPDRFYRYHETYWFMSNGTKIKKHVTYFLTRQAASAKITVSHEHTGYVWLDFKAAMRLARLQRPMISDVNDYIDRLESMAALNAEYASLPKTGHWDLSRTFVPGEGPLNAKVMLVGQAPGAQEDAQQRPFIGRSGMLLTHLLRLAGLGRDKVYITSVVQFFPPKNRMPNPEEVRLCKPFLLRQIKIVNPKIVVLLGALSAREVMGEKKVMDAHGKTITTGGRTYFVTIHPAAAVRLKKNIPLIENDFRKLKDVLAAI